MQTLEEIISNFKNGIFPGTLEGKTLCIKKLLECNQHTKQVIGIAVSLARKNDFVKDKTCWFDWCKGEFGLESHDRDHHRQIGDLLLNANTLNTKLYQRLFSIEFQKLLAISRLPLKDISKFLQAYPPENQSREKVRRCVAFCLGEVDSPELPEETKKNKNSKYQPSLWDSIEALCEKDQKDFLDAVAEKDFNETGARKFAFSGIGLLDACTSYWKENGSDAEVLAAVEADLRQKADTLSEIRNNMTAELQSAG